jgi:hypothetical protein
MLCVKYNRVTETSMELNMAKRKKTVQTNSEAVKAEAPGRQPQLTHTTFLVCIAIIALGLVVQEVIAVWVYSSLPATIHGSWIGLTDPYQMVPSWVVFVFFPIAEIIVLTIAVFSPKDPECRRVMESGKAWPLILLALLFIVLQYSAFWIRRG